MDNMANPQKGGVTRQELIDWYNEYPFMKIYSCVKVENLKPKLVRKAKPSKKVASALPEEFGIIAEEVDDSEEDSEEISLN
jgi:hypothetical protein